MKFVSVVEMAKKWNLSERTVRNYCAQGKIKGVFLTGKTWNIPEDAAKPQKYKMNLRTKNNLLGILREEKEMALKGGIYHKIQVDLAYNSNHMEGSRLTAEQTRAIFETNTIGKIEDSINVDDVIETANHFKCVDFVIDHATDSLNEKFIKELHFLLKIGTSDSRKTWFNVGEYKRLPNQIGGNETCLPENVHKEMQKLLEKYKKSEKNLENIVNFHQIFEKIHPFQDGNDRVGRLVMFKECLNFGIVPFIITEDLKFFYYRGLQEWQNEKGFLMDTILTAQDRFKKTLEYFRIY